MRRKKITPEIAEAIREAYRTPGVRYADLEFRFGYTAPVIARVLNPRKYWQQRLRQAKREIAKLDRERATVSTEVQPKQ